MKTIVKRQMIATIPKETEILRAKSALITTNKFKKLSNKLGNCEHTPK